MKRGIILLVLTTGIFLFAAEAHAIAGLSIKIGGGFIPEGSRPGGIVKADIGPISPFAEFFKKSGTTTLNLGANLLFFNLPLPILQPYLGGGGGVSWSSGGGQSKAYFLATGVGGTDLKLTESLHLFGQVKYLYTFGSGSFVIRKVAIQAGVVFGFEF